MATATLGAHSFDRALYGMAGTVNRDVQEVVGSGQFYVTPELGRELQHIDNGAQHIRLDQDLMASSRDWGTKFDPQGMWAEKQGASQALDRTAATMFDVKGSLASRRVQALQDNEARQTHHSAMQKLKGAEQAMGPYAHASVDRIKQFCDHIGVTDRYTGYRNNLNRGSRDPVKLGYSWLDPQNKNAYNGTLNVGWKPSTSSPNTMPPRHSLGGATRSAPVLPAVSGSVNAMKKPSPASSRCIQEQCGINMRFPGHTEYMNRYVRPRPAYQTLPDYIIDPAPDFTIYGRPNARAELLTNNTEKQARYEFPDSSKIDKHPWIRK